MLYDVWITMGDNRVCPKCAAKANHAWPTGSNHPHPPLHPYCRCVIMTTDIDETNPLPPIIIDIPDPEPPDNNEEPMQQSTRITLPQQHLTLTRGAQPRTYAVTLITAGTLEGHNLTLPPAVLARDWTTFDLPNLTAFVDHPGLFDTPSVSRILGQYRNIQLDGDAITATLELAPTPLAADLQPLLDLAATDPTHAPDIGLSANLWAHIDHDNHQILALQQVESVDIVFRPASIGARLNHILASTKGAHHMDDALNPGAPNGAPTAPAAAPPAAPENALIEYQRRYADATLDLSLQNSGLPVASQDLVRAQLAGTTPTVDAIDAAITTQRDLIAKLAQETAIFGFGNPLDRGKHRIQLTTPLEEAQEIVDWIFGVTGAKTPEPSMRNSAQVYYALTGDRAWQNKFFRENVMFANANTTTLADLATNAMNKIILEMWTGLGAYRWFEPLVTVSPHDGTLNDMAWISFGGIGDLPVVSEGAAYTEATVADSKQTDGFVKYGQYVGITEEMMRKSQLARIQAVPRALAISAIRTRSAKIAAIFTTASGTGPTLDDDSTVLFHSNHGSNVQTTAFSISAWKAARLECYKMTEAGSSKRLGFWPKYCLVPGDLYDDALVAFGYGSGPGGYPGTGNNDVNPYSGDARPIPVSVPDWTDTNNWAYMVDPMLQPILMMSYAQAPGGGRHPEPELFSVANETAGLLFTNDTLPVKIRDWFAYGVATWRGIGKRNVT